MIISRTPFRVSLFGGGSDYPAWYREHGGAVFGFSINKYCYISMRELPPFFEHKHRIVYSAIELINEIGDIQHPAVRAVLQELKPPKGLEIHHQGDLPARSGLGSSSSFTVGLLNAYYALSGKMTSKRVLAEMAIDLEQNAMKEHVGSQDQIWAAFGGMNHIEFNRDDTFSINPLIIDTRRRKDLLGNLMLFFTGFSRFATQIAEKQIANLPNRQSHVKEMVEMVAQAEGILQDNKTPLAEIGQLLHDSWSLKKELAKEICTPEIDEIYQAALDAGAHGGKLLGAGGGGFMLFYAEAQAQPKIREALQHLTEVHFDVDHVGSKIVVYEPDGLESRN
ncbi:MAG: kinase [Rhodospirillales bacterium]|nr:kinase [Rhodospirillales bacterium]